jgi:PAS domain S-box-containing protein
MAKNTIISEGNRTDDMVSALLESLPDAVCLMDSKGVILNTNTLFASHFGRQPQECIGANVYDLIVNVVHMPELAAYLKEKSEVVFSSGKRIVFADEKDVRKVTISPLQFPEGGITRLLITIQNISDQKRISKELQKERELKTALLDSIPCSAVILDSDLQMIVSNQCARDMLFGKNEHAEQQVDPVRFFCPDDMVLLRKKFQNTLNTGIDDYSEIKVQPHGSPQPIWMMTHTRRVDIDGKSCAVSIGMDITERKRNEIELNESKMRFNFALDAARSGIWEWNVKTDELSWSEQVWELYGLKANSLPLNNRLCVDTVHPDDREMASRTIHEAVSKETSASVEYRVCHPDGSVRWLISRGMPIRDIDGRVTRYIGAIIDITERKQNEQELIENKKRFDFALEATNTGVWEWNVNADKVTWSNNVWKLYGLEQKSLPPTHKLCESNIHPDDRDLIFEKVMAAASKEIEIHIEYRVCHRDGSIHWLLCRGLPSYHADGWLQCYIGTVTDITSRKELLNDLSAGKIKLKQALEAARAGVWEWDLKTNDNIWSDETWLLYGLEKGDRNPSFELWTNTIHPEDREMAIHTASSAADNETELNVEYRVCYYNGSYRWLMSRGKPLYDKHGRVDRYIGTIIDITERKEIEERLGRSRERLDFVLENSHIGVWDLNLQDGTTERSFEHASIFGYETIPPVWSLEKFFDHVIPADRLRIQSVIRNSIEKKEYYAFECRIHCANNELRWIWVAGAFKAGKNGTSNHVLGIVQDISGRKKAETEIRESEIKFRNIFDYSPVAIGIGDISAGMLHDVNKAWLELFGFTREEVVGKNLRDIGLFAQIEDHEKIITELQEHRKIVNSPFSLKKKSGETTTILFSSEFIMLHEKPALLVMMTDISLQEMQQLNIERLEKAVADRTQQLNQEVKRLNSFLNMISHEYRTPLAIIRGNLDLIELKNKRSNSEHMVEMNKIRRAINRLVEVMEESIHESRVFESRMELSLKPFRIVPVIASQVESLRALWPERTILYTESIEKCVIYSDPSQLKLAIFNLLDNARKYSPSNSPIEMECRAEGDEVVISIRNRCSPISQEEAELFFEKYQRGSNSMNTGGAGLGLWLVKNIIHQHNGKITLKGIASGVEATVRLPLIQRAG